MSPPTSTPTLQSVSILPAIAITAEDAIIEAEVEAVRTSVSQNIDHSFVDQLMAMACHYITLNHLVGNDAMTNASHVYKYLLEQAKAVKRQRGECREMIFTMARVKINIMSGIGVASDVVGSWAEKNIEYLRRSGLLS